MIYVGKINKQELSNAGLYFIKSSTFLFFSSAASPLLLKIVCKNCEAGEEGVNCFLASAGTHGSKSLRTTDFQCFHIVSFFVSTFKLTFS